MNNVSTPNFSRELTPISFQSKKVRVTKNLFLVVLSMLLSVLFVTNAEATHYRYGSIFWEPVVGQPNTIKFTFKQAWRRSFNPFNNPTIGSTVTTVYDFHFGDGTRQPINLTVTSVDLANDWFFGEATITPVSYTHLTLPTIYSV